MVVTRGQDDVVIRPREVGDDEAIRRLNNTAFGGTYESKLVEDLRAARLAAIELVAFENAVVGHILFSALEVTFGTRAVRALALAPMSVRPNRQRCGIGSGLVRHGLGQA